jgi:hypothetical protein
MGISFARARLTNEELARGVLGRYPEAFAVMWATEEVTDKWIAWCRDCIGETTDVLAAEPPEQWGYVVVDGRLTCDRCGTALRRHTSDHDPTLVSGPPPQTEVRPAG